MNRTKIGKALTATALNRQGARYMGIPTERMNALAWGIGGGTVTVAGALIVNFWSVNPYVGLIFTMIAFTVVALGGFGSVPGAFFAGLVVGLIMEIPGFWDFFAITFQSGVDVQRAHDLVQVHLDLPVLFRDHAHQPARFVRMEALKNAVDFSDFPRIDRLVAGAVFCFLACLFPFSRIPPSPWPP